MKEMKRISGEELKNKIDNNDDVVILDIREKDDYNEGHIKNAVLVSQSQVVSEIEDIVEDKDTVICVYCYSGTKSGRVAMLLDYLGYSNVYQLGGITNWKYELEK